jgi:hypothetical protein
MVVTLATCSVHSAPTHSAMFEFDAYQLCFSHFSVLFLYADAANQ